MRLLGREKGPENAPAVPIFDCHSHLLPGLDDGPSSWEEAAELVLAAWRDGTRGLILTPHYLPGGYAPSPQAIREGTAELARRLGGRCRVILPWQRRAAAAEGEVGMPRPPSPVTAQSLPGGAAAREAAAAQEAQESEPDLPLYLFPGCEAYLTPELPDLVRAGAVMTLGDRGTHLLIELPLAELPRWADEVLFAVALAGVTPVLAHPERCLGLVRRPDWLVRAVDRGVLLQMNAASVDGGYGREVARLAGEMVRRRLVYCLGSDAHSAARPPALGPAVRRLARLVGREEAERLAWKNAAALCGL